MPDRTRPRRRTLVALVGTTAAVAAVATAVQQTATAAPRSTAHTARAAAANCPAAYPVPRIRRGMAATGYTTSAGRTPRPFAVRVLGVLRDGISPGVDLIVIRAHSPAIKRAGGVWAGMSGSPIYAPDGRLLGALSYSFSAGPSNTAGVTPASAMYKLFRIGHRSGAHSAVHAASTLRFDSAARTQLVRSGAATPAQAQTGMRFIPTPISVSGVPSSGFAKVRKLMTKVVHGPIQLTAGGTVAPNRTAPTTRMRPGAPFVASLSTGDVTAAGIGTTTAVCHGRVLAFGHPMLGGGPTQMTMHTGSVLYIQADPTFSPFVMANVGGRTGVINQDRLTGLRARLGAKPRHLTKIVTHVSASTGMHRTARSFTPLIGWVPDTSANALYGSLLTTLQKFGTGSGRLGFAIYGRRAGGKRFHVRRSDHLASQYDIAYEMADQLYSPLSRLASNPYRHVLISKVVASARASDRFREWSVKRIAVRQGGRYVTPRHLRVHPGQQLHTRVLLQQTGQVGPRRYARFTVRVPQGARRFGYIDAVGGERGSFFGGGGVVIIGPGGGGNGGGGGFGKLLHRLRHARHNDSLTLQSFFETRRSEVRTSQPMRLHEATSGQAAFRTSVSSGSSGGGKA